MDNSKIEYNKISTEDFLNLLPENPNIFLKGLRLDFITSEFMTINTSTHERKSKESKRNYHFYDLILNNLSTWDTLPKRNKSIIGTSSLITARAYAHKTNNQNDGVFAVIPLEPKLEYCKCPRYDLLYSFPKLDAEYKNGSDPFLIQLNFEIAYLANELGYNDQEIRNFTFSDIIKLLNEIPRDYENSRYSFLKAILKSPKNPQEFLNELFEPAKHNFIKSNEKLKLSTSGNGFEIFSSGQFILASFEKCVELNIITDSF